MYMCGVSKLTSMSVLLCAFHDRAIFACLATVLNAQVKMSLQLYRVDDNTYLLDFRQLPTRFDERLQLVDAPQSSEDAVQHACTHTLEFFELCALFISVRLY